MGNDGNYTDTDAWRKMGSMDRIKYRQYRAYMTDDDKMPVSPGVWLKQPAKKRYGKQWMAPGKIGSSR